MTILIGKSSPVWRVTIDLPVGVLEWKIEQESKVLEAELKERSKESELELA